MQQWHVGRYWNHFVVSVSVFLIQYQRKLQSGFLVGMLCWTLFATSWRVLAFQTGGEMKQSKIELQLNFLQFFLVKFFNSLVFVNNSQWMAFTGQIQYQCCSCLELCKDSLGGNYKEKLSFLPLWANNSFKLHAGKSKRKAAVMLLKSFLIIHDHLLLDILSRTRECEN